MTEFTIEEKSFIQSIISKNKMSRVALIRKLIKMKKAFDKDIELMIGRMVKKLSAMTDKQYMTFNFDMEGSETLE